MSNYHEFESSSSRTSYLPTPRQDIWSNSSQQSVSSSSKVDTDTDVPSVSTSSEVDQVFGELPCVRIRGIPVTSSIREISSFFSGLNILDVIFDGRDGRRGIRAVVLFASKSDVDYAIRRHMQSMGGRFVEVVKCDRADFYRAVSNQVKYDSRIMSNIDPNDNDCRKRKRDDSDRIHDSSNSVRGDERSGPASSRNSTSTTGSYLRLRGLPFSVTRRDLINFFDGFNVSSESEMLLQVKNSDDKPTGEGYVKLPTAADAEQALKSLQKKSLGSRYIELFWSSAAEVGNWRTRRL